MGEVDLRQGTQRWAYRTESQTQRVGEACSSRKQEHTGQEAIPHRERQALRELAGTQEKRARTSGTSSACPSERTEGTGRQTPEILRCAQNAPCARCFCAGPKRNAPPAESWREGLSEAARRNTQASRVPYQPWSTKRNSPGGTIGAIVRGVRAEFSGGTAWSASVRRTVDRRVSLSAGLAPPGRTSAESPESACMASSSQKASKRSNTSRQPPPLFEQLASVPPSPSPLATPYHHVPFRSATPAAVTDLTRFRS